jgi:hypothetical protein
VVDSTPALIARDGERGPPEVDVAPAQREQLALAQTRVRGHANDLGVLLILGLPRASLAVRDGRELRVAVTTVGERARDCLDLGRGVEHERARARLAALVGGADGIVRQRERRGLTAVVEHRGDDRAVLVHGARRRSGRAHRRQHVVDLARRDL